MRRAAEESNRQASSCVCARYSASPNRASRHAIVSWAFWRRIRTACGKISCGGKMPVDSIEKIKCCRRRASWIRSSQPGLQQRTSSRRTHPSTHTHTHTSTQHARKTTQTRDCLQPPICKSSASDKMSLSVIFTVAQHTAHAHSTQPRAHTHTHTHANKHTFEYTHGTLNSHAASIRGPPYAARRPYRYLPHQTHSWGTWPPTHAHRRPRRFP